MTLEDILCYAGNRNGYTCIDLDFDKETKMIRAIEIHYLKGKWSICLRFLSYMREVNLDDSNFTQAYISGEYQSIQEIVGSLTRFTGKPIEKWTNFSKSGYYIELSSIEMKKYTSIDWSNHVPSKILIPEGTDFEIIRPIEWKNVNLETHYSKIDLEN